MQILNVLDGHSGRSAAPVPGGQDVCRSAVQGAERAHVLLPERGDLREEHGDIPQVLRGGFG